MTSCPKSSVFEIDPSVDIENNLHYIPVKIDSSQSANVETKFINRITKDEDGILQVEFRGRPFYGAKVEIPSSLQGFISHTAGLEDANQKKNDEPKKHRLISNFSEFTYWNWDSKPSGINSHVKLLDWIHVAEILHSPISATDDEDDN